MNRQIPASPARYWYPAPISVQVSPVTSWSWNRSIVYRRSASSADGAVFACVLRATYDRRSAQWQQMGKGCVIAEKIIVLNGSCYSSCKRESLLSFGPDWAFDCVDSFRATLFHGGVVLRASLLSRLPCKGYREIVYAGAASITVCENWHKRVAIFS